MQPKFFFFSGKGGVGKTTMSAASAVHFAKQGKKTLIITTDPASNLADVFEQKIGHQVIPINAVANLSAMELNPDIATSEYKAKTLAPLKDLIPEESFAVLEEQLNSPCTAEMATFDRFTDFVQDIDFEIVIFDTAPTGHTLRLLELPVEWSGVIEDAANSDNGGQTCIGPAAALVESKAKFDRAINVMRDSQRTTFVFVLRPEVTPLYEAKRSIKELVKLDIHSQELIVNGLYPKAAVESNPFMLSRYSKQQKFLAQIKNEFDIPIKLMEMESNEIKGISLLADIGTKLHRNPKYLSDHQPEPIENFDLLLELTPSKINPEIASLLTPKKGKKRTIFFSGKGGVGKTSVAAATAMWVSKQGFKTLLLTTDPASHLSQLFEFEVTDKPGKVSGLKSLWISQIDAESATKEYKDKILTQAKTKYDQNRLMTIEEELDSPCTEEMATFEKFIDYALMDEYEVIVFDTAPTGHTLRLLELPVSWSKQIEIKTQTSAGQSQEDLETMDRFRQVIDLMRDPDQTTFSFVMYPESTPIQEAGRAMEDLLAIGVPTGLIIANLILPEEIITNDYLKKRKAMQDQYLELMNQQFTAPIVLLPLLQDDLIGIDQLQLAGDLLYGE